MENWTITKNDTMDGQDYSVLCNGINIMSGNYFGDSDSDLIEEAKAHKEAMEEQ